MPIIAMFVFIILLWSTTPMAVVWSNDSLSFSAAVLGRMLLAAVCCALIYLLRWRRPALSREALLNYFVASLALFPGMLLIYWSAQYIPSGLMATITGMQPFFTSIASAIILRDKPFAGRALLAMGVSLLGLVVIFADQMSLGAEAALGVLAMVTCPMIVAFTATVIKRIGAGLSPLDQTFGAATFALPGLTLCWWWLDGQWPPVLSIKSGSAVIYLAVVATVAGFYAYFYLLKHISVHQIALIPLISPVLALMLGVWIEGEEVSLRLGSGAALVLLGLLIREHWILLHCYRFFRPRPDLALAGDAVTERQGGS